MKYFMYHGTRFAIKQWRRGGIDTEYLKSGSTDPKATHSIQVHFGEIGFIFWSPEEFRQFLAAVQPKLLFTWTTAPEFGSLRAWGLMGIENKKHVELAHPWNKEHLWESFSEKPIAHFYIPYVSEKGKKKRVMVFDIRVFFHQMRFTYTDKYTHKEKEAPIGSVEMAGKFLSQEYKRDLEKLPKPFADFGERAPETREEREAFRVYAEKDAEITYWAAQWFQTRILDKYVPHASFGKLYTFGTLAAKFYHFPKINEGYYSIKDRKSFIFLDPLDEMIMREATFAGRVFALNTGYVGDPFYNDVSKLYPIETCVTEAIKIKHIKPMSPSELKTIKSPSELAPYGWLRGTFHTDNDAWGLPLHSPVTERNYNVVGTMSGLFHTFDLEASHAEIVNLEAGYVPMFDNSASAEMDKYYKVTMQLFDKHFESVAEGYCFKGVQAASTGKLGGQHPISIFSNFPAYSTVVASAHRRLSWIIDTYCKNRAVHYGDTDSIFTPHRIEGKLADLTSWSGAYTVPLNMTVKGVSNPKQNGTIIFRNKMYWQSEESSAYAGWKPYSKYFKQICLELPDEIDVLRQVEKSYLTRNKAVATLELGRWLEVKEHYDLSQLGHLLRADDARVRDNYDSYGLARERKMSKSRAWTVPELAQRLAIESRTTLKKVLRYQNQKESVWKADTVEKYMQELPESLRVGTMTRKQWLDGDCTL